MNLLQFSDNGYYMLVATREGKSASVWDLRPNYQKSVKDFEMEAGIDGLVFDKTGKYILISAAGLHLIESSKFSLLSSFKTDGAPLVQLK